MKLELYIDGKKADSEGLDMVFANPFDKAVKIQAAIMRMKRNNGHRLTRADWQIYLVRRSKMK